MSIKLALLDTDEKFLGGIINFLNANYPGEFEIHAFTNILSALNYVEGSDMDLFVADSYFKIDVSRVPSGCSLAYFTSENKQGEIAKDQNAELIYKRMKQILAGEDVEKITENDSVNEAKIVCFSSPCGGSGTSTLASAYAVKLAKNGNRVFQICLEKFASSELFFKSDMDGFVKQDESGVYFCESSSIASLPLEEIIENINEARLSGVYDYIVTDADFNLDYASIYMMSDVWVWCCDGSDIQCAKTEKAYKAFENAAENLCEKIRLIYNKTTKNSAPNCVCGIEAIGTAEFAFADSSFELSRTISDYEVFDNLTALVPKPEAVVQEPCAEMMQEPQGEVMQEEAAEEMAEETAEDAMCEPVLEQKCVYLVRVSNGEKIAVNKPVFTLGRSSGNDYAVSDNKYVGGNHCHVEMRDDGCYVTDDNSKNHTYVNGVKLEAGVEKAIFDKDVLRLANEDFTFILE